MIRRPIHPRTLRLVLLTQSIRIGNLPLQTGDRLITFFKQRHDLPFGMIELAVDLRTSEPFDSHTREVAVVLRLCLLQGQHLIRGLGNLRLHIGNPGMGLVQRLVDRSQRLTS